MFRARPSRILRHVAAAIGLRKHGAQSAPPRGRLDPADFATAMPSAISGRYVAESAVTGIDETWFVRHAASRRTIVTGLSRAQARTLSRVLNMASYRHAQLGQGADGATGRGKRD
jgi:hypothetical protein